MKNLSITLIFAALLSVALASSTNAAEQGIADRATSETEEDAEDSESSENGSEEADNPGTQSAESASVRGDGGSVDAEGIILATDNGKGEADVMVKSFKSSDNPQHVVVNLAKVKPGTRVKITFVVIDAGGKKNLPIVNTEMIARVGMKEAHAQCSLPMEFPAGDYKAEVFLNGKLAQALKYKVL